MVCFFRIANIIRVGGVNCLEVFMEALLFIGVLIFFNIRERKCQYPFRKAKTTLNISPIVYFLYLFVVRQLN